MKKITCPNCNKKLDSSVARCSCGMDLTFDITRAQAFTKYLMGLSESYIIETIKNVYKNLKYGTYKKPCLGYNGAVEMAALLMLIKYVESKESVKTALNMAGKAAFSETMRPLQWTNYVDEIVVKRSGISENDWNEAFCYLKTYYFDEINALEFA